MSDIVKDDTQTPPSLRHQIEDVLRATQTLNGLRIEGLNHKVTAFTRAPLLLEEALAEIKALEQRHADALDALNQMTDQRDEALGGQPAIELPQHRLRVAIQEAAEYNEMIPLHTDDPHALHFQQMVKRWLDGKGMHPQQVDRVGQLALQLKDATRQCGVMADSLRYQREFVTANVWDDEKRCQLLENIDAALAGQLPDPSRRVSQEQYREIQTMLERTQALLADERATAGWAEKLESRLNELQASLPPVPAHQYQLAPAHGDVLPPLGDTVYFKLASSDSWEPYTVAGFYAWPDLKLDPSLHRVFVRGISATGSENSRLLKDVRRSQSETEQGGAA